MASVFLLGCDPWSVGFICNQTKDDIILTVKFDHSQYMDHMTLSTYLESASSGFDKNVKLIKIDSNNLIGTYRIASGSCGEVGHGTASYPSFSFFEFSIKTNKDSTHYSKTDMFQKREASGFGGAFDLIVK